MALRDKISDAPKASIRRMLDFSDMVVEGVEVENFRAYEGRQYFPLAPVTLIFGANSAGKTTLFNAIGMLRQSLSQYGSRNSGKLAIRGADVDFGIASEVPNRNNPAGKMAIRVFARPGDVQAASGKSVYSTAAMEYMIENQQPRFGIGIVFGLERTSDGSAYLRVRGYELYLGTDPKPLITFSRGEDSQQGSERTEYQVSACNSEHPFWRWFIRQYGVKLLIYIASGDLRSDMNEPDRELTLLDESVKENSSLGQFYRKLQESMRSKNVWIEELDDENGMFYRNFLQEELLGLRTQHRRIDRPPEKQVIRDLIRSNPINDAIFPEYIELLINSIKNREIFSKNGWAPYALSATNLGFRMRLRQMAQDNKVTADPALKRLSGVDRVLISGSDIPTLYPQDFLQSAAGGIAQIIENMETISARRGEFRRTFILGESEQPGELDVASASQSHLDRMNTALKNAKVPFTYDVRVFSPDTQRIASELKIGAVEVYDAVGRSKNIADVGTGTQYLLPVALAISNEHRGLLTIQEPESHLHPILQAAVASLIAASADRKSQPIVIETHSEAILRRIIDHISGAAQPQIRSSEISLLYISRDGESSSVQNIRIAEDGRLLDGWPDKARQEGYEV